jgi:hypothetical protein
LRRLKYYGLSQQDIARALGVCRSTVSQWAKCTRNMSAGHTAELWEMLTLVEAQVAAGGPAKDALKDWEPIYRENPSDPQKVGYCFFTGATPPALQVSNEDPTDLWYRKLILEAACGLAAYATPAMLQRSWSATELTQMRQQFNAGLVWVQSYQRLLASRSPEPQREESSDGE